MTSGADARYFKSDDYVVAARILITSFPLNAQCWCGTVTLVCGWSEYAYMVWTTCLSLLELGFTNCFVFGGGGERMMNMVSVTVIFALNNQRKL